MRNTFVDPMSPSSTLSPAHNWALSDEATDVAELEGVKVILKGTLQALQAKEFNSAKCDEMIETFTDFLSDWADEAATVQKQLEEAA